jgi:hypothetical protein
LVLLPVSFFCVEEACVEEACVEEAISGGEEAAGWRNSHCVERCG